MSFHKRKKKHTNSSSVVLSSTPENPISFPTLPSQTYLDEKELASRVLAANHHQSDSNGVAKMTCDNNNKDGNIVVSLEGGEQDKAICDGEVADHDLKSEPNHCEANQVATSNVKTSTSSSSSAKRKFIVLTRLFKPWKWKRKKKPEKNPKGK